MCRREKDDVIDFKRVRMLNNRPGFLPAALVSRHQGQSALGSGQIVCFAYDGP